MSSEAEKFLKLKPSEGAVTVALDELSLFKRVTLYISAWTIALLSAAALQPGSFKSHESLFELILFPTGLNAIIQYELNYIGTSKLAQILTSFPFMWFLYMVHGIITLSISKKRYFYVLFFLLICVLILNVHGCTIPGRH